MIGDVLWRPPADVLETTEVGRFAAARGFTTYDELWRWSVDDLEGFWAALWEFFGLRAHTPFARVLAAPEMPGARWFEGARLNYAEHMLGGEGIAVLARSQTREPIELTYDELREQVARARAGLRRLGVGPGDRVVAYAPNIPETLIAFIAAASLGAVWSSCAPEFGPRAVIDRYGQIAPTVLIAVAGYGWRDRHVDRRAQVAAIRDGLPSLRHVVHIPYGPDTLPDAVGWEALLAEPGPLEFDPVDFDHPLCVLFSSGTTGLPKAIVHGHGNLLVEHVKGQGLGWDLKPGARLMWFSTTSWMMWNALISGLLLKASIVLVDGDPVWPDVTRQWRIAEETRPTMMGVNPAFLMACRRAGLRLGRDFDLGSLRCVATAGSPLAAEGYTYVYEELDPDVLLLNGSGGTDVCGAFVSGSFFQPVYEGEIAGRCLAVDAQAFDEDGRPVVGQLGELVIAQPMPSMPVRFWNDPGGERLRAAYFDRYPGVWRQGDWIRFSERGSCVVTGRSDATLNRGGVRLGTGEVYAVVEDLQEVLDSLVVHLEDPGGGPGELVLFVVLGDGTELDDSERARIAGALREHLSPRHVPDAIVAVPAIPRTLTGKKLETPVKRILAGTPPQQVASRESLADPAALDAFVGFATERAGR